MQASIPSITSPSKTQKRRTGPHTAAGKARSCKNATKHGLTSRSLIQPGEDPQEYDQFIADVIKSLYPVGATEEELARQFATANWKLRRIERWEVAQAHGQAASEQKQIYQAHLAALSEQVQKERSDLRQLQEDPASDPPLILQIASMPENCPIYGYQVNRMFQDWLESLPDGIPRATLADFAKRIGKPGNDQPEPTKVPEEADDTWGNNPQSEIKDSVVEMDWTVSEAQMLVAEMAKGAGISTEQLLRNRNGQWCGELQDLRADRRHRRSESRRKIKNLEFQQQNLRVEQTVPDAPRLELLSRYESAAIRARDKSLKLLLQLQDRRGKKKSGSRK